VPIVADIDDLAPAEFLLMLSLTNKTGKLSAVSEGNKTLLVLREGSIVYAASPTMRERVGSLLVNRGLVAEETLYKALERQRSDPNRPLLGSVLIEMKALSAEDLRDVLRSQFECAIRDMLTWQGGVMIFDSMEVPDLGALPVDPADVLVGIGVDTDSLLVEGMAELIANRSDRVAEEAAVVEGPREEADVSPAPPAEQPAAGQPGVMRSLLEEMDGLSVALTAEMTLSILGAAAEVAERALLFSVSPFALNGIGGFGAGHDGAQLSGRQLRVPRDRRSVFTDVVGLRNSYRGTLDEADGNRPLVDELGAPPGGDVMVVPLSVNDEVVAVLYADGGPDNAGLGPTETVEGTMGHVAATLDGRRKASTPEWKFKVGRDREQQQQIQQ
jgi:hypothetical protein